MKSNGLLIVTQKINGLNGFNGLNRRVPNYANGIGRGVRQSFSSTTVGGREMWLTDLKVP